MSVAEVPNSRISRMFLWTFGIIYINDCINDVTTHYAVKHSMITTRVGLRHGTGLARYCALVISQIEQSRTIHYHDRMMTTRIMREQTGCCLNDIVAASTPV